MYYFSILHEPCEFYHPLLCGNQQVNVLFLHSKLDCSVTQLSPMYPAVALNFTSPPTTNVVKPYYQLKKPLKNIFLRVEAKANTKHICIVITEKFCVCFKQSQLRLNFVGHSWVNQSPNDGIALLRLETLNFLFQLHTACAHTCGSTDKFAIFTPPTAFCFWRQFRISNFSLILSICHVTILTGIYRK